MNLKNNFLEQTTIGESFVTPHKDIDGSIIYLPNSPANLSENSQNIDPQVLQLTAVGYPLLIATHLILNQGKTAADFPKRTTPLHLLAISGAPKMGKTETAFMLNLLGFPGISLDPYSNGGNLEHYQNYFSLQCRLNPGLHASLNPALDALITAANLHTAKEQVRGDSDFPKRVDPKFSGRELIDELAILCLKHADSSLIVLDAPGYSSELRIPDIFDHIGNTATHRLNILPASGRSPILAPAVFKPHDWLFTPQGTPTANLSLADLEYLSTVFPKHLISTSP